MTLTLFPCVLSSPLILVCFLSLLIGSNLLLGHFDDPLAGLHAQVDNLGAPENNAEIVFLMKHLKKVGLFIV